jgi:hypothetical protein
LQVGDTLKNSIVWFQPLVAQSPVSSTDRSGVTELQALPSRSSTLYIQAWNSFIISQYLYIQNRKPFVMSESMSLQNARQRSGPIESEVLGNAQFTSAESSFLPNLPYSWKHT